MITGATFGGCFGGRTGRLLAALIVAALTGCATPVVEEAPLAGSAALPVVAESPLPPAAAVAPAIEAGAGLGIQVTALRLSAGGFMLDLRYRVADPERARPLLDRKVPVYLVDGASGARLGVPSSSKLGKLRQATKANIQTDRDYGMLFANPGRFLKAGAKVTLVAGGAQLAALTVQ